MPLLEQTHQIDLQERPRKPASKYLWLPPQMYLDHSRTFVMENVPSEETFAALEKKCMHSVVSRGLRHCYDSTV